MSKILPFRLFPVFLTAVMVVVVHSRACGSDFDCDKDCCIDSTCSSCPLRTTSSTNTDPTPSSGQKTKENVSPSTNNNQIYKRTPIIPAARVRIKRVRVSGGSSDGLAWWKWLLIAVGIAILGGICGECLKVLSDKTGLASKQLFIIVFTEFVDNV